MQLYHIALNNLRRRKVKILFILLGLTIGIATMVSVYGVVEAMKTEMTRQAAEFGANVVITGDSGELTFSYGGITLPEVLFDVEQLTMNDVAAIDGIPLRSMIRAVAPKLLGVASTGEKSIIVAGGNLQEEFSIKPWLRLMVAGEREMVRKEGSEGGEAKEMVFEALNLSLQDISQLLLTDNQVLVGASAAAVLGVEPGDAVTLSGSQFQVFGLLEENGSPEDEQILMNLSAAQTLFGRPGEVTVIELAADYTLGSEEVLLRQLNEALPKADVTSLRQEILRRDEMLTRLVRFGMSVSVLVLFVGTLVAGLTMSGAVRERTREIGVFRAIGFRKSHITKIILLEGALVSAAGGMAGYLSGTLAARYAGPLLAGMDLRVPWRLELFLTAVALAVMIGLLAGIYPARQAAKLDPAEALRFI